MRQDRPTLPLIKLNTNKTRKTKNKILAIPAAPAAIPPKPSTPAMIATMRNMTVHLSIIDKSLVSDKLIYDLLNTNCMPNKKSGIVYFLCS